MKMLKLTAAVAAASMASMGASATGDAHDGALLGAENGGGSLHGSSPVAILVHCETHNHLQRMQFGVGSSCIGNRTKTCAPSLSSGELRAMLGGTLVTANNIVGAETGETLGALNIASTEGGVNCNNTLDGPLIALRGAAGTHSALRQFAGGGTITGGLSAGPGADPVSAATFATVADDAAANATCDAGVKKLAQFCFVHAANLDSDTYANTGFVKLDGVAPDLASHLSANYNLVSNVINTPTTSPVPTNTSYGMVNGIDTGSESNHHNIGGTPFGAGGLSTNATSESTDGGAL